jgi:hypothetical protein
MMRSKLGSWLAAAVLVAGFGAAAPARATTDVIQRSFENMPQGVVDSLLSPYTSGRTIYNNLTTIQDTTAVRVAYVVPGYLWNVMCNFGGGLVRSLTGVMELPTGLVLLFSDAEMEPLFDPVEDNDAVFVYDEYEDTYRVKLGVDYTTGG